MDRRSKTSQKFDWQGLRYFICLIVFCLGLIISIGKVEATSKGCSLDTEKTLGAFYKDLKQRFEGASEFTITLSKSEKLIKFHSLKPVNYEIRIPNMVGKLQKKTKSLGPAKAGFLGSVRLIEGDTRLYQAVYPQIFQRFFERGKILYTNHAWAPYSKKYNYHIKANFLTPGKSQPPHLLKFASFVQQWDKIVVLKSN